MKVRMTSWHVAGLGAASGRVKAELVVTTAIALSESALETVRYVRVVISSDSVLRPWAQLRTD